jgi:hypothetical protein
MSRVAHFLRKRVYAFVFFSVRVGARWGCSLGGKREKRARTTRMRASAKNLVEMCVCTE